MTGEQWEAVAALTASPFVAFLAGIGLASVVLSTVHLTRPGLLRGVMIGLALVAPLWLPAAVWITR